MNGPIYPMGRRLLYLWQQGVCLTGCERLYESMGLQGSWGTKGIRRMQGRLDRAHYSIYTAGENLENQG